MGGRGASSGVSTGGNKYGSQNHTVLRDGNIKFVTKNQRTSETLMETMTKGRVYVTVGGDELLQIMYFDSENKRTKVIDLSHPHDKERPHTHHGYEHNENDSAKTLKSGAGPNTIYNRVKQSLEQAHSFVIDITKAGYDNQTVEKQIEKIYRMKETALVDEIVIVDNGKIVKVVKRK